MPNFEDLIGTIVLSWFFIWGINYIFAGVISWAHPDGQKILIQSKR